MLRVKLVLAVLGCMALWFSLVHAEVVTLQVMGVGLKMFRPGWYYLAQRFEELNPGVKVEILDMPFEQFFPTLEARLSAKETTPDVFMVDEPTILGYAVRGYLLDLTPYYTPEDLEDFLPNSLAMAQYNGKYYTFPWDTSTQLLFYNIDMFKQHGIGLLSINPEKRLTWEEVVEIAKILSNPPNTWGLAFEQVDRPYQLLPLPQSLGAEVISPDGLSAKGYIDSPLFITAGRFYYDLFHTWKVSPQGLAAYETKDAFIAGKIGMFIGGAWNVIEFPNLIKTFNWGVAPHPYFAEGKPVTPTGSWHVGVNPQTRYPELAVKLARFLTSQAAIAFEWKFDGCLPARRSSYWIFSDFFEMTEEGKLILYEIENTATPRPYTPGYVEYEAILAAAFSDIRAGVDPETALTRAALLIDRELAKYKILLGK